MTSRPIARWCTNVIHALLHRREPEHAEPDRRQGGQRDQPVELARHRRGQAAPVAQRGLGDEDVEPFVCAVEHLLALHPGLDGVVEAVDRGFDASDPVYESSAGVLGGLQRPRNDGRLEDPRKPGTCFQP